MSEVANIERRGAIGIVTIDNPPVNALSHAVRSGLAQSVETLANDDDVKAIVIHCAGRTFFAGADIREFNSAPQAPHLPEVIQQIEDCPKPVIAALHGTALGGGCEVALGCHYRIAVPAAKLGLPEIKLGLLPGAGGTQRMPRLIGARAALDLIVSGEPIGARKALDAGMIDAIADGDILEEAIGFAQTLVDTAKPVRKISAEHEWTDRDRAAIAEFDAHAAALVERKRGLDAPRACVESVRNAIILPFAQGMRRERELFMELKDGTQSAAQRHLFFAERAALKINDMPRDVKPLTVARAAVLGSGTMGGGIAMNFANAGIPVTIIDPAADALERGLGTIRKNYERSAQRSGKGSDWVDARMALITPAGDMEAAGDADLVIEAVFEDMALKKEIFARLDAITKPSAVLATNTSTLDINEIAAATSRPQSVLGMHFFSPANVMRLLEVVRAEKTGFEALAMAIATGQKIAKIPVTVGVCHGFVGNRMLYARGAQVERLLVEGASPQAIDSVLVKFGFPMGPCAMGDLAGLDVGWRARKQAGRVAPVADAICELGRFGQKTGKGYYIYREGSRRGEADPEIDALIRQVGERLGVKRREISESEILERLIFPMVNEGARILDEGIAVRSSDIDVIWIYGYAWPVQHGGPMFHADQIGLKKVCERLEAYAEASGDESLKPSRLIRQLAEAGKGFSNPD
ncbi:MAG: 3-hydroxyacyl-CoA dehydrogenase NAD-binding domain-containing protein [Nitratireductor sp.]